MSKNIFINDNLEKKDDDLLPFPRYFAECVAGILDCTDAKDETRRELDDGRKFVSSVGFILK